MKRYRDMHAECEAWYKEVKMWDGLVNMRLRLPRNTIGRKTPVFARIKQSQNYFDNYYLEIFWRYNTNPRPSGRKR